MLLPTLLLENLTTSHLTLKGKFVHITATEVPKADFKKEEEGAMEINMCVNYAIKEVTQIQSARKKLIVISCQIHPTTKP